MTYGELLVQVRQRLERAALPEAPLESEILIRHAAGLSKTQFLGALQDSPGAGVAERVEGYVERRLRHEPLAYITGKREFYNLEFSIDKRVLIPRPESETLVEQALALVGPEEEARGLRIIDVGTGSGALAIALAINLPFASVTAVDISQDALDLASHNVIRHLSESRVRRSREQLESAKGTRVELVCGDLLEPVHGSFDMLVANLPYISERDWEQLAPEIRDHEPKVALVAEDDGLALVARLLQQLGNRRQKPRWALFEVGYGQAQRAKALAEEALRGSTVRIYRDLAGIERGLVITLR